jgi:hypothetical protein
VQYGFSEDLRRCTKNTLFSLIYVQAGFLHKNGVAPSMSFTGAAGAQVRGISAAPSRVDHEGKLRKCMRLHKDGEKDGESVSMGKEAPPPNNAINRTQKGALSKRRRAFSYGQRQELKLSVSRTDNW